MCHTYVIDRVHAVGLVVRVEVAEWGYTSTIECHIVGTSWFISCIIDVKVIFVRMTIELSCYCVFKPKKI